MKGQELLGGGRVKGGMLKAHIRWVTDHKSAEEIARFWSAVPGRTRLAVGGLVLEINWYQFSDLLAIDRAIVEVFGNGDPAIVAELGRYSARLNLSGSFRPYRRSDVHAYCQASARVHSSFQDFGSVEYRRIDDTSCEMIHSNYTSYSPLFCASALGYYEEAVAIHGGFYCSVRETTCQCRGDESCTFVIAWS